MLMLGWVPKLKTKNFSFLHYVVAEWYMNYISVQWIYNLWVRAYEIILTREIIDNSWDYVVESI
jgi:hypothetical protein